MFKIVRIGDRAVFKFKNLTSKRSFLSEAYQCQEAWQQRFNSPLLQKVKKSSMFYELENRFQNTGQISALDIDLFVNSTTDDHQTDEIINLLSKFRKTAETSHTLDSTHHAVIRHFMKHNHINQLLPILHDRLNYGIFPDHFCYNLLMDTLIKEKDFASASKVAVLLMLQEDSDHPISNALCVYSCHKYLENPIDWEIEENKPEEPVEEVKVRVKYIINPYFDDHFDLRNSKDLVGKTLAFQGKLMNDALGRSLLLRGLVLYKKYTKANHLIQKWLKENTKDIVFPEIFDLIKKDNSHLPEEQITDEYKELLNQLDSLQKFNSYQGNLDEAVEKTVQSAVERCKEEDVAKQIQFYQEWEEKRKLVLDQQMKEINRLSRLAKLKEIKEDLENKERLLTFFDKEEQIELEIERKELIDKQNCEKLQYQLKKIVLEEEYIPPDVKRRKQ